mmetsp:Transcript_27960/g.64013  ORF Transcript_27960/g.64013 Transcript_27960/m.64013 type:complete len:200 (-) Transcript_27960:526-1125(-)
MRPDNTSASNTARLQQPRRSPTSRAASESIHTEEHWFVATSSTSASSGVYEPAPQIIAKRSGSIHSPRNTGTEAPVPKRITCARRTALAMRSSISDSASSRVSTFTQANRTVISFPPDDPVAIARRVARSCSARILERFITVTSTSNGAGRENTARAVSAARTCCSAWRPAPNTTRRGRLLRLRPRQWSTISSPSSLSP